MRLKVCWESNIRHLGPSRFSPVFVVSRFPQGVCYSFPGGSKLRRPRNTETCCIECYPGGQAELWEYWGDRGEFWRGWRWGGKHKEKFRRGAPFSVASWKTSKHLTGSGDCWRRSSRGCDLWLTHNLYLGKQGLLAPSAGPGMCVPPAIPTVGVISRMQPWKSNVSLGPRGLCTGLNPPLRLLHKLRFWRASVETYLSCCAQDKPWMLAPWLIRTANLERLPLSSAAWGTSLRAHEKEGASTSMRQRIEGPEVRGCLAGWCSRTGCFGASTGCGEEGRGGCGERLGWGENVLQCRP